MSTLRSKQVNDVLVVGISAHKLLDDSTIQAVGSDLNKVASEATEGQRLLLTFADVEFMSSAMLGKLVLFLKTCKQRDVVLKVCSITPGILEVFKITNLNKMFDIYKDEQTAMKSFDKKSWFS